MIGSGPHEAQVQMHDLAAELGLRRTYFVGPRPQDELTTLFNCADVGCFPSYREPFGLVFIECMACGTPVIGADSGGPRDFVTPEVGTLVPETDDRQELARVARRGRHHGRSTRTGSRPRARWRRPTCRRTSAWRSRCPTCSPRWTG